MRTRTIRTAALAFLAAASLSAPARARQPWLTAYYTGWRQDHMPPDKLEWGEFTHIVHFGVVPRADGTIDAKVNMLTPANVKAAVSAAHAAGRKILFTVGGQNTRDGFVGAIAADRRAEFIERLVRFMRKNGYDGIDVDMEPLKASDSGDYARFVRQLRARLDKISPRPLLFASALWEPIRFGKLADEFDQINLMTYNLSGPYPGWTTWHSGAIRDGGQRFPNGKPLPSVAGVVRQFVAAGVPRRKIAVGFSFSGYVWSGGEVCGPRQAWTSPPAMRPVPYYELAKRYGVGDPARPAPGYAWDEKAEAPYLCVEGAAPVDREFVSYHDEHSAAKLLEYAREEGLGGMLLWDVAAGWIPDRPEGERHPVLKALGVQRGRGDPERRTASRSKPPESL